MKKISPLVIIVEVVLFVAFYLFTKTSPNGGQGDCTQYSHKDGYTGCMGLLNSKDRKDKKCKFKVENKINQETQKMEFNYLCLQK